MPIAPADVDQDADASVRLQVTAVHGNAMLTRLTALLGQHDIDHFSYTVATDGCAHVVVGVRGGTWQVDRVAARLARIVGVLDVTVGVPGAATDH